MTATTSLPRIAVMSPARTCFGTVYPATPTAFSVEVGKKGEYITIFENGELRKTFKVGDKAEYDSYNLSYIGEIVRITEKTVTIQPCKYDPKKVRMSLYAFCGHNKDFDLATAQAENAEEMMYI